jgi:outer membrane protein assembly factor BamA
MFRSSITRCLPLVVVVLLLGGSIGHAATREEVLAALEPYAGQTITRITLAGNNITKDWVITREIHSEMGDPLDLDLIREDIVRLENLAIFGAVVVVPGEERGGVTLDFRFTEMPWIIPFPALRYTEENGFSIGLGVASPNFLGQRMILSASALFGGTTTARFKGENPWITGNHLSAGLEAYHQVRTNELLDFEETSDKVEFFGGVYLGQTGRLMVRGGYCGVGSDEVGVTLDDDDYDDLWNGGVTLGLDSRDSWRTPHEGWKNELAVHYFGGDADYLAVDLDVNVYVPIDQGHTLATGPLLSLQTGDVGAEIPSYQQYFLGGANSVRGYRLDELGKEIFGKHQLIYNLEYRWNVRPVRPLNVWKWSVGVGLQLAAFADAGIAWSEPRDFGLDRTRMGFGLGARLLVPAAEMVRLDVGMSQDGDVVFSFGTSSIFFGRRLRVR